MEESENKGKNPKSLKTQKQTQEKRKGKSEIHHSVCLRRKKKRNKKWGEKHTSKGNVENPAKHQFGGEPQRKTREVLQRKTGEENTQSNDWKFEKSEREKWGEV